MNLNVLEPFRQSFKAWFNTVLPSSPRSLSILSILAILYVGLLAVMSMSVYAGLLFHKDVQSIIPNLPEPIYSKQYVCSDTIALCYIDLYFIPREFTIFV